MKYKYFTIALLLYNLFATNLVAQTWSSLPNLPSNGRYATGSFSINNIGYIVGGEAYVNETTMLTDCWAYNPINSSWTRKADYPGKPKNKTVSFAVNGVGYYGLGTDNTMFSYNPITDAWTQLASANIPGATYWSAMFFVIGETAYFLDETNKVYSYNTSTDTWLQKNDFPGTSRVTGIGFSVNGKGYIGTGVNSWSFPYLNDLWEYSPSSDTWNQKNSIPGEGRYASFGFSFNGKGYVIGGEQRDPNTTMSEFWEFDPITNSWESMPSLQFSRNYLSGFVIGNSLYTGMGGFGYNNDLNEFLFSDALLNDIDGNVYKTLEICDNTWMAENLNVSHYRNGDPIPEVKDYLEWSNLTTGAWCYYENKTENGNIYGKLYNWYAITDPRGLAPEGWRVSDGLDWGEFDTCFEGGFATAGGSLKAVSDLWDSPNTGATNSSGFSALPGGFRTNKDANLDFQMGKDAWFILYNENEPVWLNLYFERESINGINLFYYYNYFDKTTGVSVRCVKGKENVITFNTLPQKTYGDAPFSVAATASSGLPITFISSNPSVAAVNGNTITITGAGTVTITALQNGNHEYGGAAPVKQTLVVSKSLLTVTADNKSRTYGDANPAFTITFSGFKNSESSSVIDTAPTAATTATLTSSVGNYNIVPAGGTDNNYTFSYVNGTLTITKATLTATADNKSRIYGNANPPFTITYSGFKNSESSSVIDTAPTATTTATITSNVGNYNIVPTGGTDNNYMFNYVNGTLTITKATLTATAANKNRIYGDANPAFTITYSGFKNSETASVIDTPPTATTSATPVSDVGNYSIELAGGLDNNYSLTYINGMLTVNKSTLTVTADNRSRGYGDVNPTLTVTYSGFKNSQTASVLDSEPTVSTMATQISNVGSYGIVPSGGTDGNYTFQYISGTLTITKAALIATADNKSRLFGEANPIFTISYSGFKNSETVSVLDTPPVGSTSATSSSPPGNYDITVSGGADNNYSFTYVNGTLSIVNSLQTITFTPLNDVVETIGSFALSATASSGLPVSFSTADGTKITISGNTVTILEAGSVTITASQPGNSEYPAAPTVSQTICILPAKPVISASGLGTEDVVLTSSSSTGNQWYRNGTLLPGSTGNTYTISDQGVYAVKVTKDGCSGELSEGYAIIYTNTIDPEGAISLSLYPNPVGEELRISIGGVDELESSAITIYDATGRIVGSHTIKGRSGTIQLETSSSGYYLMHLVNSKLNTSVRFIKE